MPLPFRCLALALLLLPLCFALQASAQETRRLSFESEDELLADFVSQAEAFRGKGLEGLKERKLAIVPGRFGKALQINDGWPVSKDAWNQSGLDCDLTVAVMWGEWRTKPHYWGAGAFHGSQGTVAFWVKRDQLEPGVVFMQGSIAWGRKERDLFDIEVDAEGRFSAKIRDIANHYHTVTAEQPSWVSGEWQHLAVAFDNAYGMRLFHNGVEIASTWGKDAWWQTTPPGLFSPFLPEACYDELIFFDAPLDARAVRSLYLKNTAGKMKARNRELSADAQDRLMKSYGILEEQELPECIADWACLVLKQSEVVSCRDEAIPAGWVMDGRYELAWPHPYRLFTFILGDADFHGEKVDLELAPGEQPDFVSFEGMLEGLQLLRGSSSEPGAPLVLPGVQPAFFEARRIQMDGAHALHIPMVKEYGLPEEQEGSARMPLSGSLRIHEMQLWELKHPADYVGVQSESWQLSSQRAAMPRYQSALDKLMSRRDRQVLQAQRVPASMDTVCLQPLAAMNLFGPETSMRTAVDAVLLGLRIDPKEEIDYLRVRVHDPGDPYRIWAQTWVRVEYSGSGTQSIAIKLDITDLFLAQGDRLWVDVMSRHGGWLSLGGTSPSSMAIEHSKDSVRALQQFTQHELLPARIQYIKEYNYRPWRFSGEKIDLANWSNFGGPYAMAYAPLSVLQHDPGHHLAGIYKELIHDRVWPGAADPEDPRRLVKLDAPEGAPEWAIWQRELYRVNLEATNWIVQHQRKDGMFWGGSNDDCFIPLGYAALPLLGDEPARKSWLSFYEGMERLRIFHDGYCDIWPIDPLHITDYICSRGLMLANALGDPYVFERELRTSERYAEKVAATNARRAGKGLPPLTGKVAEREKNQATLVEQVEAEILEYSLTHLRAYWGETPAPEQHTIADKGAVAERMKQAVLQTDEAAIFALTEGMIHTDNQRGIGREDLIATALGGRVQGRIEPYPTGIAVSWEDVQTPELARFVSRADSEQLVVNLYNFTDQAISAKMRIWRLAHGRYKMAFGKDVNDDGRLDAGAKAATKTAELERFSVLPVTVPPKQNMLLTLDCIEKLEEPAARADLAISPRDISGDASGVKVVVHNIGNAEAKDVEVVLLDKDGGSIERQRIEHIASPRTSLAAQRVELQFAALPTGGQIVVDCKNSIDEIFEENNLANVP